MYPIKLPPRKGDRQVCTMHVNHHHHHVCQSSLSCMTNVILSSPYLPQVGVHAIILFHVILTFQLNLNLGGREPLYLIHAQQKPLIGFNEQIKPKTTCIESSCIEMYKRRYHDQCAMVSLFCLHRQSELCFVYFNEQREMVNHILMFRILLLNTLVIL